MYKNQSIIRAIAFVFAFALFLFSSNSVYLTAFADESVETCDVMEETEAPAGDFTHSVLNDTYCTITGYTGTAAEIVIPSEIDGYIVQQISDNAFKNNTILEKVVFPETLESVGVSIFYGCTKLTYVELNSKLTNIGDYMFYGCTALLEMTIPNGVASIGGYAFSGCTGLTEVKLPSTLTAIYSYAFQNCLFESIDIPDSVTTMSARAFYNCTKLSEIGYPSGWTTTLDYNNGTYYDDSNSDYRSPFEGCSALETITVDGDVTAIPKHAFRYQTSLEEVFLPENLTTICAYAFYGCTGLKAIKTYEITIITGKVVDESGVGLSNVQVTIYDETTDNMLTDVCMTNADGIWKYPKAIVGRKYVIGFNNLYYKINTNQTVLASSNGNTLDDVIAIKLEDESATDGIAINEINFPDEIFRAYVKENFDKDTSSTLSDDEVGNVTTIDVNGDSSDWENGDGITSLKGIEYFSNLTTLYCNYNQLTQLNINQNTSLGLLYCSSNHLTSLDVSGCTALTELECDSNNLETITIGKNGLTTLKSVHLGTQSVTIPASTFVYSGEKYIYNSYAFDKIPENFTGEFTLSYDDLQTTTMTINYTVITISAGDFNGNGSVDSTDLVRLRNYLANYDYMSGKCDNVEICTDADMNGDGVINLKDLVAFRRALANMTE